MSDPRKVSSSDTGQYNDLIAMLLKNSISQDETRQASNVNNNPILRRPSTIKCHPGNLPPTKDSFKLSDGFAALSKTQILKGPPTKQQVVDEVNRLIKSENISVGKGEPETEDTVFGLADTFETLGIVKRRALYNLTGDPRHLSKYLPVREYLEKNDPEGLKRYDEVVQMIMEHTNFRFKDSVVSDDILTEQMEGSTEADMSTKYMVAASIAELYYNRPDLIEKALSPRPLTIFLVNGVSNDDVGGFHKRYDNSLAVSEFWYQTKENGEVDSTPAHEITHAVDQERDNDEAAKSARKTYGDVFYKSDGILPGMTEGQMARYLQAIEQLKARKGELENSKNLDVQEWDYALSENNAGKLVEFPTTTIQMFLKDPEVLKKASPELYNLYLEYFKFDPMQVFLAKGKNKTNSSQLEIITNDAALINPLGSNEPKPKESSDQDKLNKDMRVLAEGA